ncbi:MAG: response regulator [Bacteroidia bacterium]
MLKEKKILIVDDDERNIFALSAVLRSKGPELIVARDGRECLDMLNNNNDVDIILMDMMMPVMDGYETIKEIRKTDKLKHHKIICLTAQAMIGDKEKCLAAGADDYSTKPVDVDELLLKIGNLLSKKN